MGSVTGLPSELRFYRVDEQGHVHEGVSSPVDAALFWKAISESPRIEPPLTGSYEVMLTPEQVKELFGEDALP